MPQPQSDFDALVMAWRTSIDDIQQTCKGLNAAQWQAPTACPGWNVADVVAHIIDAESMIADLPRIEHHPDWTALPHVATEFGRMTEVGVDARRGRSASDLLSELDEVIAIRDQQLRDGPRDLTTEVQAFTSSTLPLGRLLTMRTFDTWVHSQDIRDAVGQPGGLQSPGAKVCADLMISALPRIWGKTVAAPAGAVLTVHITGPGIERVVTIEVQPDGRAIRMPEPFTGDPAINVTVRGSWPAVMHQMTGRSTSGDPVAALEIDGDPDLISVLVPALNIAP
jgi:uncharacterized protein (TIGR03083 family)